MAKKIFIVDDDEGILAAFEAMFEGEGYIIETYANADFIAQLQNGNIPDLILLDVLLSGADGRVLCKRVKHDTATKHVPIIMLSAAPDVEKSVYEACADGYIKKPFEMGELLTKVTSYLGRIDIK